MKVFNLAEELEKERKKNKELKEKINMYENPDDMTLMFMWCDEKAKDKIKQLQERIDKAIEEIELYRNQKTGNLDRRFNGILNILKGNEEK